MKNKQREEETPAAVLETAKQAGAVLKRAGRSPAEPVARPEVWTERMLGALVNGVKGRKWYSLMDKVYAPRTLELAFEQVARRKGAPGTDHQTIEMFGKRRAGNLARLERELRDGSYCPKPVKRVWIPKPGSKEKRPLGIPTVRDRVVQAAARMVMEPVFEHEFAEHSYGFRPGRGCKDALRRVDYLLKTGCVHVVDADLSKYFDTIPRGKLMGKVKERISDGRLLALLESFLRQGVLDGLEEWTPEAGTPQGAVLSPLLANIYLNDLDHLMANAGIEMVRYADDFVLLTRSAEAAEAALALAREWTEQAGLTLHPEKTRIAHLDEGFDFLGYHFQGGKPKTPRKKSLAKLKDAIREKTRRANGHSLGQIIATLNLTLRGWFEYYKHCGRSVFKRLDGWIRMRLRSILRRREGRNGCGYGFDHMRWPNAFFAARGLLFLLAAHEEALQSYRR